MKASSLETRFVLFESCYFFVISFSCFEWHVYSRKWEGFECNYLYCRFSGNYYCMKPAESFSGISVLVAVVCEVGQRGLKIYNKMRGICWAFHN